MRIPDFIRKGLPVLASIARANFPQPRSTETTVALLDSLTAG